MDEEFVSYPRNAEWEFERTQRLWARLKASTDRQFWLLVFVLAVSVMSLGLIALLGYRFTIGPGATTMVVNNLQQNIEQATTTLGAVQQQIGAVQQSIGSLSISAAEQGNTRLPEAPPTGQTDRPVSILPRAVVSGTAVYLGNHVIYQTNQTSVDGSPAQLEVSSAPSGQVFLILDTTRFELETLTNASLYAKDGTPLSALDVTGPLVWSYSWAPMNDLLATATWNGGYLDADPMLKVWNPQTGRIRRVGAEVRAGPLWSPDGRWLAYVEILPVASEMQGKENPVKRAWQLNLASPDLGTVISLGNDLPGCSEITADPRCELAWHQVDSQIMSLCVRNPLAAIDSERCYRVPVDPLVPPEEIGEIVVGKK